jgi:GH24 family phage-related lysozyme (muramidase)
MRLTNWARQSYEYGDYSASAGFAEEALRFADLSDEYVSSQLAESLYASIDGVLFDKNIRTLIKYPQGKAQRTYYVIPSSITSIVGYAFYYCSILTGVSIPSSVLSIGGSTFAGCSNLTSITVDNRNPTYASIDGVLFDKNIQTLIRYPQGRTQRTYVIPSSVTEIGYTALAGCSSLTNIIIPSSVTYISYNAFADTTLLSISVASCSSLTSISVDNRNPAYASIDGVLFDKNIQTIIQYPVGRNQKTYVIPSSVTTIGDGAFSDCSSLTNVTIPSSVTSVGYYAFAYCSNLTSVIIPYSVTSIRDYVFWGCSSLTSVTIPSSVSSIGGWAFYGCSSLTSVTIPSSVTSIGNNAFADCSSLTSVTLSRRTQVGERAFPPNTRITYRD